MHEGAPPPRVLAGKYRLGQRLAQGGMGAVWRAEHLQLKVPVAVKLMSPKMLGSEAFRARFEREARAAAQLKSRHVVTVHDYGFDGEEPFIVMELLDGEDLSMRLRREKRLAPEVVAHTIGQIARALDRAHGAGLVHRDLKPANIFLARLDDEVVVKVLDFGIAKAFGDAAADGVTGDDEVLGTPQYMSPEQIRKSCALDLRVDLWALSVIAYRMLTGVLPFTGDTRGDIVVRVCTEQVLPPSLRESSLGPAVDRFFERALAKQPQDRFDSARGLSAALDAALGADDAAQAGWQRASMIEIPATLVPTVVPSAAALFAPAVPPPEVPTLLLAPPAGLAPGHAPVPAAPFVADVDTLSVQPTHVLPPPREPARSRRRAVLVSVAVALAGAAVAVPFGLGVLDPGETVPPLPAASVEPAPQVATAAPTSVGAADRAAPSAPPAAPSAPSAAPTATPSPSSSAGPILPAKPVPNKRRKVVIGL